MNGELQSAHSDAFRRLDATKLEPRVIEWLNNHAQRTGAKRSALHSETLGCAALLGLTALIAAGIAMSAIPSKGLGLEPILAGLVAVLAGTWAFQMVKQFRKSTLSEFELITRAYFIRSRRDGTLEAYCWALCRHVNIVNHYLNGIYSCTTLECHFGSEKLEFNDNLAGPARTLPMEHSERFRGIMATIANAQRALRDGRYPSIEGGELFPVPGARPRSIDLDAPAVSEQSA